MKSKFTFTLIFGGLWLAVSLFFAIGWAQEASYILSKIYVWWVIIGIALLPGFLMSSMFFSNLLNWKLKNYPDTTEDITIITCAHNEEQNISQTIRAILQQQYAGHIRLIVVDNASTDNTKEEITKMQAYADANRSIEYVYCPQQGKAPSLNMGLAMVCTPHFITVDADTYLEKHAVQKIMNHIVACRSACVAGNLFVHNAKPRYLPECKTMTICSALQQSSAFRAAINPHWWHRGLLALSKRKLFKKSVGGRT